MENSYAGPKEYAVPEYLPNERPIWRHRYLHIGMSVLWWPNANEKHPPRAATVTSIGNNAIDLALIDPDSDRLVHVTACHHMSSRHITPQVREETGGWDHTPTQNAIFALAPDFAEYPEQTYWKKWYAKYLEAKEAKKEPPPYKWG